MDHRGGAGLEPNTGDGAGILFQTPHRFFRKEAQKCGCLLPDEGDCYGVAMLFLPRDPELFAQARELFEQCCNDVGLPVLFSARGAVDAHDLGVTARACQPRIWQAFMVRPASTARGEEFGAPCTWPGAPSRSAPTAWACPSATSSTCAP